jgi:hypothetical protein
MTEYLLNNKTKPVGLMDVIDPVLAAGTKVITVGVGKMFSTISAAVQAAGNGATILVDAGTYKNDFITVNKKLTIIGVGGMVNLVATIPCPDHKAIMTVQQDLTLKNFSFTGATVSAQDGGNGAGIRYEGGKLVLSNDAFYNNQNGLMGGAGSAGTTHEIDISNCLFSGNGSGSGNTHNIYVGAIDVLNVTSSIFEKANVGHELKSRALANNITGNWFRDGPTGTASYDIDLPNGGVDVVKDNVIEKGPLAQNNSMVHYGGEGLPWADSSLLVEGNTFINDKNSNVNGVLNQSGIPVTIENNTFVNVAAARIAQGPADILGNVDQNGKPIANASTTDPVPGSTTTFTDSAAHSVTLGIGMAAVRGGAGLLTAYAAGGHVVVIGGSGGVNFTESATSGLNQITTMAGSTNTMVLSGGDIVDSRGTDKITTSTVSSNGTISGTAAIDATGTSDMWTIKGSATITAHGANPWATLMSGASLTVNGVLGNLNWTSLGGNVAIDVMQDTSKGAPAGHINWTVTGGSTSGYIYNGATHIATAGGAQGATIHLGDGNIEVISAGKDTIYAGSGNDNVVMSNAATLYAGTGNLTIFGHVIQKGNEAKVYGNGGSYTFGGDTGNIIYYGGDKASTANLQLSFLTLIGGNGKMTINGGNAETIIGGSGGLEYTATSSGSANITTAVGSKNVLRISSGGVDSWGNDTIIGGNVNDTIIAHGDATISGGLGTRNLTLMGNDTVADLGQDNIKVTKGANVSVTVGAFVDLQQTGAASAKVTIGGTYAGSAVTKGGAAEMRVRSGQGPMVVSLLDKTGTELDMLSGTVGVLQTSGADTIHVGNANANVYITSSNVTVYGESGNMTLHNPGKTTGLTFIAGSGTANVDWYSGGNDIVFGSGTTNISSYTGPANLYELVAGKGGGTDVISGFRLGTDHLKLEGVTVASKNVTAGSANFVLSDNTHLKLVGVTDLVKAFA